jgi:hypothetical protein
MAKKQTKPAPTPAEQVWFGLKINGELKAVQPFTGLPPHDISSFNIPFNQNYYKEGTVIEIMIVDVTEKSQVLKVQMKDGFYRSVR